MTRSELLGMAQSPDGHTESVERHRSTNSLHDLVAHAVTRARRAQADSAALISDHETVHQLVRTTVAGIRQRRATRASGDPTSDRSSLYGN